MNTLTKALIYRKHKKCASLMLDSYNLILQFQEDKNIRTVIIINIFTDLIVLSFIEISFKNYKI